MAQTCLPERTRSLPNGDLQACHVHFFVKPVSNFRRRGGFEEEFKRFPEILARLFNCPALACDVQFRAERHVAISFALQDRRELSMHELERFPIAS